MADGVNARLFNIELLTQNEGRCNGIITERQKEEILMLFVHHQIKVEFSMKFTSRDLSLKRTPSKKQSGVFGVKINVVTK